MLPPVQPSLNTPSSAKSSLDLPLPSSIPTISLSSLRQSLAHLNPEQLKKWADNPDEKGRTPLALAVEAHSSAANKTDLIIFLIKECKADVNQGDNQGWTPLYRASTGTKSSILTLLVENKAKVSLPNIDGSIPLHRTVDRGNVEDVKTLLRYHNREDINTVNCFGTSLAYAAKNGNVVIAELLLAAAADPNLVNDPLDRTPAALAENNKKEAMRQFLESKQGLAIIPVDSPVHTPLSKLVHKGNEEAILQNFAAGEKDQYGRSVAHYCADLGKVDILKKMAIHGSLDLPDDKGRTPLHYAAMKGQQTTCAFLISEEGKCDYSCKDPQGYTPLMWACQYNQNEVAKGFLEHAQKKDQLTSCLTTSDKFGWKVIHKSAQVGNVDLVRMFVEDYDVDATEQLPDGRSPLDLARATKASEVEHYLTGLLILPFAESFKKA